MNDKNTRKLASEYLSALLKKDRPLAEKIILSALESGVSIREVYLDIFQPVQWKIGHLWQANKISVAMEHYCTAATQFIMSRLYEYIFNTEKNGKSLVATTTSGELHELGIRMVSDFFELEGWNTFYLGANTPKEGVLDMVNETKADILAISTTIYFNIPEVKELIHFIRKNKNDLQLKIMVGGRAFSNVENLWKEIGADGFATDANSAIIEANKLITNK